MSEAESPELFAKEADALPRTLAQTPPEGIARVVLPERQQIEWKEQSLDDLVGQEHRVRGIWGFIERMDMKAFHGEIRAVEGGAGRPSADPRVMLALWVYATAEGVGSGRELDRLTQEHIAFRWLRGGVPMDYHTLNDFRTRNREAMDDLLTQVVGVMLKEGLVQLHRVAQDGTRVRASTGAGSFHRGRTLERHLEEARRQVEELGKEVESPDPHRRSRQEAAKRRAVEDRAKRVEEALRQLPEAARRKQSQLRNGLAASEPRVSSTDPDARVMKMANGGFRPAYNVQLATDAGSQVIVGVSVTNEGTDAAAMPPMLQQIRARTGHLPKEMLVDSPYADHKSLAEADRQQVTVYAPVRTGKKEGIDPHMPKSGDPPAVAAWRLRMATEEAKKIYKERAATAECVNAAAKEHRGLRAVKVRGLGKVLGVAVLFALTHDILRYLALAS